MHDAAVAAAYRTNPNLPDFVHPHCPLIHASGFSAYEIFCSLFPDELLALLVEETNRYYGEHCEILRTAHMANFQENVEEMVVTTREAVAGRNGGAATTGGGAVTRRRRPVG